MNIVTIGTTFVDVKGFPNEEYIPGGRNAGRVEITEGGVGRNIAENIANCRQESIFISAVDDSSLSEGVLSHFHEKKISTRYMKETSNGLGTWLAVFNEKGDVVAQISNRPNMKIVRHVLDDDGDDIFKKADSIIIEADIDEKIVGQTFELADKHKKPVYMVVGNMSLTLEHKDYLKKTGCFICNEQEAGMLAGNSLEELSEEALVQKVYELAKTFEIKKMVVTLGAKGAVYADIEEEIKGKVDACPTEVVDTTGAGDAFFSGTVIGLTHNLSLENACRIGSKLAASTISGLTNVCGQFDPEELF